MKKLLLIVFVSSWLYGETIAVVVSKNLNASDLSKSEVKRIFLSKTNKLDSSRIKVYEIRDNNYKKEFYKNVLGKSIGQLRSYWARLIFTGKAQPPRQVESVEVLIRMMEDDASIISYVSSSKITRDMKVLYTMGE